MKKKLCLIFLLFSIFIQSTVFCFSCTLPNCISHGFQRNQSALSKLDEAYLFSMGGACFYKKENKLYNYFIKIEHIEVDEGLKENTSKRKKIFLVHFFDELNGESNQQINFSILFENDPNASNFPTNWISECKYSADIPYEKMTNYQNKKIWFISTKKPIVSGASFFENEVLILFPVSELLIKQFSFESSMFESTFNKNSGDLFDRLLTVEKQNNSFFVGLLFSAIYSREFSFSYRRENLSMSERFFLSEKAIKQIQLHTGQFKQLLIDQFVFIIFGSILSVPSNTFKNLTSEKRPDPFNDLISDPRFFLFMDQSLQFCLEEIVQARFWGIMKILCERNVEFENWLSKNKQFERLKKSYNFLKGTNNKFGSKRLDNIFV